MVQLHGALGPGLLAGIHQGARGCHQSARRADPARRRGRQGGDVSTKEQRQQLFFLCSSNLSDTNGSFGTPMLLSHYRRGRGPAAGVRPKDLAFLPPAVEREHRRRSGSSLGADAGAGDHHVRAEEMCRCRVEVLFRRAGVGRGGGARLVEADEEALVQAA